VVRFGAGGAEHALRIGKATPIGSNVYARTGASPDVHMIASHRATAFTRSLTDLRDKQILAFDPTAIAEVEASWPGGRVVVAREPAPAEPAKPEGEAPPVPPDAGGDWRMTVPLAARADSDEIDDLLSTLSFLRADAFVDAPTAKQLAQLERPDFELRLANRDPAQPPLSVAIGRPEGEHRLVRAAGDVLYQIAATRIADFPRTVTAYRERHLAQFPATDAQQVDFFFSVPGGDPVAIRAERSGDAGWTSSPEPFAAGKLASVVSELSRLEAADIVAESVGERELEKLGLSPPNTIITVLGAAPPDAAKEKAEGGGEKKADAEQPPPPAAPRLAEVHLGNVTPEGVVAQAGGDPIVYRLDPDTAEQLPVNLEAFQSRFREQAPAPEAAPPPEEPGTAPPPPTESP
jgi:hypothetical protein